MPQIDWNWIPVLNSIFMFIIVGSAFFKYSQWKSGEEDRAQKLEEIEEKLIIRVCKEVTNSVDYKKTIDQRIQEIAAITINNEFRLRSSSFVSSERYIADTMAVEKRLAGLETAIRENTKELGNVGGQITATVTTQLTAFLSTKIFAGKD